MITLMTWITCILAATVPAQGRNWMVCNTSCYRFAEHEEHWYSAMEYCTSRGWLPLKIDDQIEFNYVQHQLREHYDIYDPTIIEFWIGAFYNSSQGQWMWYPSHEVMQFKMWAPGEPNAPDDCVGLLKHENFFMNGDKCSKATYFICEEQNGGQIIG